MNWLKAKMTLKLSCDHLVASNVGRMNAVANAHRTKIAFASMKPPMQVYKIGHGHGVMLN